MKWILVDLFDGTVKQVYNCEEHDFTTKIPFDTTYEMYSSSIIFDDYNMIQKRIRSALSDLANTHRNHQKIYDKMIFLLMEKR